MSRGKSPRVRCLEVLLCLVPGVLVACAPGDWPRQREWRSEALRWNARAAEHQRSGDYDRAVWSYQKALERARAVDAQDLLAMIHHNLGTLHQTRGELSEALEAYKQARESYERLEDEKGRSLEEVHLAGTLEEMGRMAEARDLYQKALTWARREGERSITSLALAGLARLSEQEGDMEQAVELFRRSLELDRKTGNRGLRALHLSQFGALLVDLGRWPEARQALEEALTLDKSREDVRGIALDLYHLTRLHWKEGEASGVAQWGQRALPLLEQLGMKNHLTDVKRWLDEGHRGASPAPGK